jgi:hypothetical protein
VAQNVAPAQAEARSFSLKAAGLTLLVAAAVAAASQSAIADEGLERYVAEHHRTLSKIHSLHLQIENVAFSGDGEWLRESFRWWGDGSRYRWVQTQYAPPALRGATVQRGARSGDVVTETREVVFDGQDLLQLVTPSRDSWAERVQVFVQGNEPVPLYHLPEGTMTRAQTAEPGPYIWFLLGQAPGGQDTLRSAVAKSERAEVAVQPSADVVITLRNLRQDSKNVVPTVHCTLDASKGYLIRKLEYVEKHAEQQVVAWMELGSGVALPRRVVFAGAGGHPIRAENRIVSARVNEPLKDEEFFLEFPEGAVVVDSRQTPMTIHLWGAGNRPARTFASAREYDAWFEAELARYLPEKTRQAKAGRFFGRNMWMIAGNLALVVLLVGLLVLRRHLRHRGPMDKTQAAPQAPRDPQ